MNPRALVLAAVLVAAALVYNTKPRVEYVEITPPAEAPYVILVQWCDQPATSLIIPQPGEPVALPPDEIFLTQAWDKASKNARVMFLEICYEEIKT